CRFGALMIIQHPVLVITQGEQGFSRVRVQFLRILQSTFRCVSSSGAVRHFEIKLEKRVLARKPRPSKRKIGVKLHRPLIKTDGFLCEIMREGGMGTWFRSDAVQIRIVGLWIFG